MKISWLLCAVLVAGASNAAFANADLARAKNCMSCHSVQNKVVGPAFKDVAAKYAGQKGAEDKLVQKVMKGGGGVWGTVPMPPNTQVSEAEAHTLVKWILSLK
jgi:cytochrome c